jgi:hypothetical protein
MNKYILLFLLSFNLFADNLHYENIKPECRDLFSDYSYYQQKADKETLDDMKKRWQLIADSYNQKLKSCEKQPSKKSYYRANPYNK